MYSYDIIVCIFTHSVRIQHFDFRKFDPLFEGDGMTSGAQFAENIAGMRVGASGAKTFENASALTPQYETLIYGLKITQQSLEYVNEDELAPQLETLPTDRTRIYS